MCSFEDMCYLYKMYLKMFFLLSGCRLVEGLAEDVAESLPEENLKGGLQSTLGWPGGEVKVTKKKEVQMIFLPLMVLGNESPKEF